MFHSKGLEFTRSSGQHLRGKLYLKRRLCLVLSPHLSLSPGFEKRESPRLRSQFDSKSIDRIVLRQTDNSQSVPSYLRDLFELYQVGDVRTLTQLESKIKDIGRSIDADVAKIRNSRIGEAVRRWIPIGLTSALSIGAVFVPHGEFITAFGTVLVSIIGENLRSRPLIGHFQGVRSLLLCVHEDIITRANRLPLFLNPEPLY